MNAAQKLTASWAHLPTPPPATEEQITRLEAHCGRPLPGAFLDLLRIANGIDADDRLNCFWSTEQMLTPEALQHLGGTLFLTFADHCLRCHDYALNLETAEVVLLIDDQPTLFAPTFTHFVETYMQGAAVPPLGESAPGPLRAAPKRAR